MLFLFHLCRILRLYEYHCLVTYLMSYLPSGVEFDLFFQTEIENQLSYMTVIY